MSALRVVFAGTPHFALPCLEATLASGVDVVAVYTQPDRPAGRGRQLMPSPVKQAAVAAGVKVMQPVSFKAPEALDGLQRFKPDLLIVVAYGLILPKSVLATPTHGCWNVHASMLPRWRGAAPIQRAIMAGDAGTGVCLMQMEAGLDTGPVLLSLPTPIAPRETAGTLHDKLAALGAQVLGDGLKLLRVNLKPVAQPQPSDGVTYAHKLEKSEAQLDLALPAIELERKVRAFVPWPVAELVLDGERLRVHAAEAIDATSSAATSSAATSSAATTSALTSGAAPGTIVGASRDGLDLATGAGVLRITRVQREGGKPVAVGDYLNARRDLKPA